MITPEAQKIIDAKDLEIKNLKERISELENQIEKAKEAVQGSGEENLFDGIF